MRHHTHHSVNLPFFRTELQLDKFHRLFGQGDQFLSVQNRVFVASQECRLEDGLKAVSRELRASLLVSSDQLVEFVPVVPWPQLQEADQPVGVRERVDDRCAGIITDQTRTEGWIGAKHTQSNTSGRWSRCRPSHWTLLTTS